LVVAVITVPVASIRDVAVAIGVTVTVEISIPVEILIPIGTAEVTGLAVAASDVADVAIHVITIRFLKPAGDIHPALVLGAAADISAFRRIAASSGLAPRAIARQL
jgi:hypothetical protein